MDAREAAETLPLKSSHTDVVGARDWVSEVGAPSGNMAPHP